MLHHFVNLLSQIIRLWFSHMGTTVIGLGCGLISSIYEFLVRRHRAGGILTPIWRDISKGVKITLAVWFALFVWCTVEAVYKDHQELVLTNGKLVEKIVLLTSENTQLKAKIGSPSDESKEKIKREAIRSQLGKLLSEGDTLRHSNCQGGPDPDCLSRWQRWNSKVERYLTAQVGSSYAARFKASQFMNTAPYVGISQEMNMLDEFLKEFN